MDDIVLGLVASSDEQKTTFYLCDRTGNPILHRVTTKQSVNQEYRVGGRVKTPWKLTQDGFVFDKFLPGEMVYVKLRGALKISDSTVNGPDGPMFLIMNDVIGVLPITESMVTLGILFD